MTAVTVFEQIFTGTPGEEVLRVQAVDGYTYTSKIFGKISGADLTFNTAPQSGSSAAYVSFSGAVATINCLGLTGATATLTLRGSL